jgi:hypothetical protein
MVQYRWRMVQILIWLMNWYRWREDWIRTHSSSSTRIKPLRKHRPRTCSQPEAGMTHLNVSSIVRLWKQIQDGSGTVWSGESWSVQTMKILFQSRFPDRFGELATELSRSQLEQEFHVVQTRSHRANCPLPETCRSDLSQRTREFSSIYGKRIAFSSLWQRLRNSRFFVLDRLWYFRGPLSLLTFWQERIFLDMWRPENKVGCQCHPFPSKNCLMSKYLDLLLVNPSDWTTIGAE